MADGRVALASIHEPQRRALPLLAPFRPAPARATADARQAPRPHRDRGEIPRSACRRELPGRHGGFHGGREGGGSSREARRDLDGPSGPARTLQEADRGPDGEAGAVRRGLRHHGIRAQRDRPQGGDRRSRADRRVLPRSTQAPGVRASVLRESGRLPRARGHCGLRRMGRPRHARDAGGAGPLPGRGAGPRLGPERPGRDGGGRPAVPGSRLGARLARHRRAPVREEHPPARCPARLAPQLHGPPGDGGRCRGRRGPAARHRGDRSRTRLRPRPQPGRHARAPHRRAGPEDLRLHRDGGRGPAPGGHHPGAGHLRGRGSTAPSPARRRSRSKSSARK